MNSLRYGLETSDCHHESKSNDHSNFKIDPKFITLINSKASTKSFKYYDHGMLKGNIDACTQL